MESVAARSLRAAELIARGNRREAEKLLNSGDFPRWYTGARVLKLLLLNDPQELQRKMEEEFSRYPVPRILLDHLVELNGGKVTEFCRKLQAVNEQNDPFVRERPLVVPNRRTGKARTVRGHPRKEPQPQESLTHGFRQELASLRAGSDPQALRALVKKLGRRSGGEKKELEIISLPLARLLEEQGHLREALEIYEALPDPRGENRARIAQLRRRLAENS
jgi:hypothetical protein